MIYDVEDLALRAALEQAVGHIPPFSNEEMETIEGPLVVQHARDLSALCSCPNLRHLTILASDVADLEALRGLTRLLTLRIACSPVTDVNVLAELADLQWLDLLFTFVEDVQPILDLPRLEYGVLLGNPWSEQSFEMLRKRSPRPQNGGSPVLDISPERDWKLSRSLFERGFQACFSHFNMEEVLVRPGIPVLLNANCDFFKVPEELIKIEMMNPDFTIEWLFKQYFPNGGTETPFQAFDFENHVLIGNAGDAERWLQESELPEMDREALSTFVRRFRGQTFYREDGAILERRAQEVGVTLPAWLHRMRQVLAFVLPHHRVRVRFDGFDGWSPYIDQIPTIWYEFGLLGVHNRDQRGLLDVNHMFPVAIWSETGHTNLAIQIEDNENQQVYEYDEALLTNEGWIPQNEFRVVFTSYASMLSHLAGLQLDDGQVIEAHLDED